MTSILTREQAEGATDEGWVSPLRAGRAAKRLQQLAEEIGSWDGTYESRWALEIQQVAHYLVTRP